VAVGRSDRQVCARRCPSAPQDPTVNLQEADVRRTTKLGRLARGGFPRHRQATLRQRDRDPGVGTRSGSSAINRLARSARVLASFASYADPLLSHAAGVSPILPSPIQKAFATLKRSGTLTVIFSLAGFLCRSNRVSRHSSG
jgi:hypothetical protein